MGNDAFKGTTDIKQASLMDPVQLQYLQQAMRGMGPQAQGAIGSLLKQFDPSQMQGLFKQAFIDPALMAYNQDILPAIRESAVSQGGGSSGSLNQALAASAQDLATGLGSQMGQFYQGQQELAQRGQLGGLGILGQMLGMHPHENIASANPSPFQQLGTMAMGGASMMTPWYMGGR